MQPLPKPDPLVNDGIVHPRGLRPGRQMMVVGAIAAAVAAGGAVLFASGGPGYSEVRADQPARNDSVLTLTREQLTAIKTAKVEARSFFTEIDAEGYLAPNAGFMKADGAGKPDLRRNRPLLAGQTNDLVEAETNLASAQVQYRLAAANETRQHQLYDAEGAALKDWRQAQADLASATATLAAARNKLALLGGSPGGEAAKADGEGVFSVSSGSRVWLVANVREADSGLVTPGARIEAHLPGLPGETIVGQVSYLSPSVDASSHRLTIGALLSNAERRLRPNMQASCRIFAGPAKSAAAVPVQAIIYEGDKTHVWVVNAAHQATLQPVALGRSSSGFVEVISGLDVGQEVATSGALFLDRAASTD